MTNEATLELAHLVIRPCCPSVHRSGCPCGWTPWKLRGYRLHTIPLQSLTLQLSAHQEWEDSLYRTDHE